MFCQSLKKVKQMRVACVKHVYYCAIRQPNLVSYRESCSRLTSGLKLICTADKAKILLGLFGLYIFHASQFKLVEPFSVFNIKDHNLVLWPKGWRECGGQNIKHNPGKSLDKGLGLWILESWNKKVQALILANFSSEYVRLLWSWSWSGLDIIHSHCSHLN